MNQRKLVGLAVILCLVLLSNFARAETRNIYIGDIIRLEVSGANLTEEKVKQNFKAAGFEIVNIKQQGTGYRVAVRNFTPGEKTVELNNKTVKINIQSTLEEINREQIYRAGLTPQSVPFSVPYRYLLYGGLGIAAVGLSLGIWKFIQRRDSKDLTPYQRFQQRVKRASVTDDDYFARLTLAKKKYLEEKFNCQVVGKTAPEVVEEISRVDAVGDYQTELETWLEQTAVYKYTPQQAAKKKKRQLKKKLKDLVEKLEAEAKEEEN